MINIWFISDTHFNHNNILSFKNNEDKPLRPFSSVEEMNETMIENWNKLVKPQDKIYHLGDVILGKAAEFDPILSRLNGKKRLLLGNHDIEKTQHLAKYFDLKHIFGAKHLNVNGFKCVLSHIPLHTESIKPLGNINIHGHIHCNTVRLPNTEEPDPRYVNICVEKTDYKPINLEEIKDQI